MGKSKNKYLKGKKMMKRFLILLTLLLAMMFSCSQLSENNNSINNIDNGEIITTGKIVGKATYTNASNHAGIQVTLVSSDGIVAYDSQISSRSRSAVAVMKNVVTSESGEYSFDNVKEGVYTIYASSDDSTEKAVLTNVVVQANQIVTATDLNLTATGSISGRIIIDGNENENLGITVVIAGTSYMAVTDSFGFFTISDIPAGSGYQIVIMKGDYCTIWKKVSVEARKENNLSDKNISSQKVPTDTPSNTDSFIWQGSFAVSPANPEKYWAYFNTTDGCSYIYDGAQWTLLAQAGADGEDGANGNGGGASVEHKITYELNGGTNSPYNPNLFLEYLTVNLKNPTRDGYCFAGWYENADFSGNRIKGWEIGEKRTDVTLYAKWIEKAEVDASRFGVYSYTLNIEDISEAWGGTTTSPSFSVILLTDEQVEVCKAVNDFKQAPADNPEYQLDAYGSMKITDTSKIGDYAVYGANPVNDVYQYYNGVAATITNTTFTLTVDMTKLDKTQLKALFAENGMASERPITEDDMVYILDYKPYVIALGDYLVYEDNYVFTAWSASVMKMEEDATFPIELIEDAPKDPTCYDLNYIAGSMTEWVHTALENNSFTFIANGEDYFNFTVGNWGFNACGVEIDALDKEIALVENNDANITFKAGVLTEGRIYTITLIVKGEHEAYVKVTGVQAESINITSTPYKTSYYVGEELNLDGLTVEATYSDGSTSVVTVTSDMVSGFDSSVAGTQTLTVTYGDCTAIFDVEVIEITADNVADCLAGLDYYNAPYTITVTGEINTITLSNIKAAIANNSSIKINLDLSQTTGLTEIPDDAFYTCSGLTNVTIPNSVTSIGDYAFYACRGLTNVTIPNSVTTIGDSAFYACSGLTNVTIPNSVTNIGYSLFSSCTELVTVTIPDSITEIKGDMFRSCTSLTNITIPESITTIDNAAFYNCKSLTSVTIPDSVTSIGAQAFYLCHSLASAIFTTNTDTWYYTSNSNYSDGIVIDVTNSSNNAAYLRDIYASHYWYKQ